VMDDSLPGAKKQTVNVRWLDLEHSTEFHGVSLSDAETLTQKVGTDAIVKFDFYYSTNRTTRHATIRMDTVRMITYGNQS